MRSEGQHDLVRLAVRVIYTDEELMVAKTICRVLGLGEKGEYL